MKRPSRITDRQREVINYLSKRAAFSPEKAHIVVGFYEVPAEKLAQRGLLNKLYNNKGTAYWIRGESEVCPARYDLRHRVCNHSADTRGSLLRSLASHGNLPKQASCRHRRLHDPACNRRVRV